MIVGAREHGLEVLRCFFVRRRRDDGDRWGEVLGPVEVTTGCYGAFENVCEGGPGGVGGMEGVDARGFSLGKGG